MTLRPLALCLTFVASAAGAQAPSPATPPAPSTVDILRRTEQIIKRSVNEYPNPDAVAERDRIDAAARIAREAGKGQVSVPIPGPPPPSSILPRLSGVAPSPSAPNLLQGAPDSVANRPESGIYLFASDSMTDEVLKSALEVANDTGAIVVFRGVRKGLSISKTFARVYRLAARLDPIPQVNIDPTPFNRFDVASVPAVVVYDGDNFVKVSGSLSVSYAERRFKDGVFGDAGARGPTTSIVEPDLIAEMAERAERVDWESKKQGAIARYWNNVKFHTLPVATKTAVRYFDPTVVNKEAIVSPDGAVIAPAGAVFNPLDIVPFTKTIVAFDATQKAQFELAKRIAEQETAAGRGVILLMTAIDLSRPWEAIAEYNRIVFPNRVFLLDDLVASRFGIVAVPSVIRAEGRQFRIEEVALRQGGDQ